MGINEVDMISDNWLCFILMGHLFVHFLCEFDLINLEKATLNSAEGELMEYLHMMDIKYSCFFFFIFLDKNSCEIGKYVKLLIYSLQFILMKRYLSVH